MFAAVDLCTLAGLDGEWSSSFLVEMIADDSIHTDRIHKRWMLKEHKLKAMISMLAEHYHQYTMSIGSTVPLDPKSFAHSCFEQSEDIVSCHFSI